MLTDNDLDFIRNNRADVIQNRTEPVTLTHESGGNGDPYFPEEPTTSTEVVYVVWSEQTGSDEIKYVNGVEVREDDAVVSFDLSVTLSDVTNVKRNATDYKIVAYDGVGIGGATRYEALVRRVV